MLSPLGSSVGVSQGAVLRSYVALALLMNFSVLCSKSRYLNHPLAVIPILEILFLNYEDTAQ